jgi:predicted dehydrogenase
MMNLNTSNTSNTSSAPVVRIGVLGAGTIAKEFCDEFVRGGALIVGVADIVKERADALAASHGARSVCGGMGDLLSAFPDVTLVYVGVPPAFHSDAVLRALEAGKHVLCEKPLSLSGTDSALMCAAARRHRAAQVCAINFPLRFVPAFFELQRLLRNGYVGDIRSVDIVLHIPRWPRTWQAEWVGQRAQGGVLRELGSHLIFALHELCGTPRTVRRIVGQTSYDASPGANPSAAEVAANALVELHAGVAIAGVTRTPPPLVRVDMRCNSVVERELITLAVAGSAGRLELREFTCLFGAQSSGPLADLLSTAGSAASDAPAFMSSTPCALKTLAAVKTALTTGVAQRGDLVGLEYGQQTQRVLEAILSSAGEWIHIEDPIDT